MSRTPKKGHVETIVCGKDTDTARATYRIDWGFDIVGVSEAARRERSAFKPVYSMNRWWARRASVVFRSILLGLREGTEPSTAADVFLNARVDWPGAEDLIVLDPFMGGGTTVVEALRVGARPVGVDLNPLAWFIVRNETSPIDAQKLTAAYRRVEALVAAKIAELYSTECPHCERSAEIVHTFWAKTASCGECNESVTMRRSQIVGKRRGAPEIRYSAVECGSCGCEFHAELDQAELTRVVPQAFESGEQLWSTVAADGSATCPRCEATQLSLLGEVQTKRIEVFAVQCPACQQVQSRRGPLPEKVACGSCGERFAPAQSNTARGRFECRSGHSNSISDTARSSDGPLGFEMTSIEGYCNHCATEQSPASSVVGYRFFKEPDEDDLERYARAKRLWRRHRSSLPWPRGSIRNYEKTNRLVVHNYERWNQLFNERQILSLAWILDAIKNEGEMDVREALTAAFLGTLEHHNMLNLYYLPYAQSSGAFGRHDFHPKVEACEGQPWGGTKGRGTFRLCFDSVLAGKRYLSDPFDADYSSGRRRIVKTGDSVDPKHVMSFSDLKESSHSVLLRAGDSRDLSFIPDKSVDHVVTDPPYADAVQYSELADFFFVWLREALGADGLFAPDESPKSAEVVQNKARGMSDDDFHAGLAGVFRQCHRVMRDDGRLVFTFHHSQRSQWEKLIEALHEADFELIGAHPVASEGTRSGNLVFHTNRNSAAYDIVHVCRKRRRHAGSPTVWSDERSRIGRLLVTQVRSLLSGDEHGQRVYPIDVSIMAWAETMKLFSASDAQVIDDDGELLPLSDALDDLEAEIQKVCESLTQ